MSLKHIMLDIETWGTSPYSVIIMIGACVFDPYASQPDEIIADRFEVAIDPASSAGLRTDAKAVLWWMDGARDEARRIWLGKPKLSLYAALDGFTDWLLSHSVGDVQCGNLRIWGNGSDFDNVLLQHAYEVASREVPWSFRHNRCFRTLRNLLTFEEGHYLGTAHTALADAENQAIRANQIVRLLGMRLT
jgi:exodeoxyribonuclease VIII